MYQSETIGALAAAMAKFQGEVENAKKNAQNPHLKNKYADLAAVWDAVREPLSKNGLAVLQPPMPNEGAGLKIRTIVAHASGEWIASEFVMPLVKNDPQGLGSAITYARRYAMAAMLGIAQEDDDATAATQGRTAAAQKPAATAAATETQLEFIDEQVKRVGWGRPQWEAWAKKNAPGAAMRHELTKPQAEALLEHLGGLPDKEAA